MSELHKCEICEQFISPDDLYDPTKIDGRLVYTGGYVPEPSHDVYWHVSCDKLKSNILTEHLEENPTRTRGR